MCCQSLLSSLSVLPSTDKYAAGAATVREDVSALACFRLIVQRAHSTCLPVITSFPCKHRHFLTSKCQILQMTKLYSTDCPVVLLVLVGIHSDVIETICICHQLTATGSHTLSSLTVLGSDTSTDNSATDVSALACLVSALVLCFCL